MLSKFSTRQCRNKEQGRLVGHIVLLDPWVDDCMQLVDERVFGLADDWVR